MATSLNEAFALVVRERRMKLQLSQEKLGELAGLDRSYLSKLERAETTIGLRKLEDLADALDTKPHLLIKAAESRSG